MITQRHILKNNIKKLLCNLLFSTPHSLAFPPQDAWARGRAFVVGDRLHALSEARRSTGCRDAQPAPLRLLRVTKAGRTARPQQRSPWSATGGPSPCPQPSLSCPLSDSDFLSQPPRSCTIYLWPAMLVHFHRAVQWGDEVADRVAALLQIWAEGGHRLCDETPEGALPTAHTSPLGWGPPTCPFLLSPLENEISEK